MRLMKIRKDEYCKFYYFLSHWNYMRQRTKLSKKSRKTQFTHNARKSSMLLRMIYAQDAINLIFMQI